MIKIDDNKKSSIRMNVGEDIVSGDENELFPLNYYLHDDDVVDIINNYHEEIIEDESFFKDDDLLYSFFSEKMSNESIRELFE